MVHFAIKTLDTQETVIICNAVLYVGIDIVFFSRIYDQINIILYGTKVILFDILETFKMTCFMIHRVVEKPHKQCQGWVKL